MALTNHSNYIYGKNALDVLQTKDGIAILNDIRAIVTSAGDLAADGTITGATAQAQGFAMGIKLIETGGGVEAITLVAPAVLAANISYVLPTTSPLANQALTSSAVVAGVATLSWTSIAASANPTFTGVAKFDDGTAALPSITFTTHPTTGIFLSGVNVLGFTTAGVEKWVINSSGALNPAIDNTYDIGNGAVNPRDINVSRNVVTNNIVDNGAGIFINDLSAIGISIQSDLAAPSGISLLALAGGITINAFGNDLALTSTTTAIIFTAATNADFTAVAGDILFPDWTFDTGVKLIPVVDNVMDIGDPTHNIAKVCARSITSADALSLVTSNNGDLTLTIDGTGDLIINAQTGGSGVIDTAATPNLTFENGIFISAAA